MRTIIIINGLEIEASVGIYEKEKLDTQRIVFNLELETNLPPTIEDNIERTVSYETIINDIKKITASKHYELLETLVFDILNSIKKDTRITGGFIEILKPDIFDDAQSVGVKARF